MSYEERHVTIRYDSKIAANVATGKWRPKANLELAENIKALRKHVETKGHIIHMEHVKSHIGIKNNERADKNALSGATGCKNTLPTSAKTPNPTWMELEMHDGGYLKKT